MLDFDRPVTNIVHENIGEHFVEFRNIAKGLVVPVEIISLIRK